MDTLDVWNIQLVDYGKKVIKERQNFIMMLNNLIGEIHSKLTSGKEKLEIIYDKNVSEDEFEKVLADKVHVDLNYMSTQTGPHRDDIMFMINGIDARRFGSQGQQRTVALSLKIAEIKLVKNIINDNPILLLDDVMSELDSSRREALLEEIKDIQTIITCTGYDDFIKEIKPRIEFTILNCGYNCKESLEKLPLKRNKEILQNIINLGMMDKYEKVINSCNCKDKKKRVDR